MPPDLFEWIWLGLFLTIATVRKVHVRRTGGRITLAGMLVSEATMMLLWALAAVVLPLVYIFSPWLDFADFPFPMSVAPRLLGVALFVFAIWLLHRSHADLGKLWSPTVEFVEGHTLVAWGAYRRIRHPMYAAHVLWGLAQLLLLPNFIAGPWALVLMCGIMAVRIPREERALIEQFGDAYLQYRRRTGYLLPKLTRGCRGTADRENDSGG
jgi:protein-S-isoprenylcysteine O-methyltransferase Ste14